MIEKLKQTIQTHELIQKGDRVVVALSGGPDSVCLLHLLYELKDFYGIELYGAHLNHHIRGLDALKDAQYAVELCESLSLLCFVKSVDVPDFARNNQLSLEEAGRIQRYLFFEEVAERVKASKVAVAHHQNDQAETLLMRLLRGTGLQGLGGIPYRRDRIIRPLLDHSRKEVEHYCQEKGLVPRIDESNLEPIYHRNKIRLELVPLLEEQYNPKLVEALGRTARILSQDGAFIDQQAEAVYRELRERPEEAVLSLSLEKLKQLPPSLLSRALRLAAEELASAGDSLEYKHIDQLIELIRNKGTGKRIQLPGGLTALLSYEELMLTTKAETLPQGFIYRVAHLNPLSIPELKAVFEFSLIDREELTQVPRENDIKAFDYDQITGPLTVRTRAEGDTFVPMGAGGSKKLKDFFIDQKIQREKRNQIPLLCDGDRIMWVVGYRMSEIYKISLKTKRILLVKFMNTSQ